MESAVSLEYAKRNRERYLTELKEFLTIPTISALPEHKGDIRRGADWLTRKFTAIGLDNVGIVQTSGHPVVYGERLGVRGGKTVLIYAHYDVQPVDPVTEWASPPFEPTVRDDEIHARGASDTKANALAALNAVEASLKTNAMPVNVKVMFEGEEEIGSPSLSKFMETNQEKLRADVTLSADALIAGRDQPSLAYGVRGVLYLELWIYGPKGDLHSGEFGGAVHNPAQALSELIAGMHDANARVTLPSFYDRVRSLSKEERAEIAHGAHSDDELRRLAGVKQLHGEKCFTSEERIGARPTLEVNGLLSGFTGEGPKTVIPSKAMAKISMRLIPDQDPDTVEKQFNEYVRKNAPATIRCEVRRLASASPGLVNRDSLGMRAAARALEESFGVKPIFRLEGGTLPLVSMVKSHLGVDTVMMGFSTPNDNFHAPNEKYYVPNFHRGTETYIRFLDIFANQSK